MATGYPFAIPSPQGACSCLNSKVAIEHAPHPDPRSHASRDHQARDTQCISGLGASRRKSGVGTGGTECVFGGHAWSCAPQSGSLDLRQARSIVFAMTSGVQHSRIERLEASIRQIYKPWPVGFAQLAGRHTAPSPRHARPRRGGGVPKRHRSRPPTVVDRIPSESPDHLEACQLSNSGAAGAHGRG